MSKSHSFDDGDNRYGYLCFCGVCNMDVPWVKIVLFPSTASISARVVLVEDYLENGLQMERGRLVVLVSVCMQHT